jgi:hypothetical protein
LHRNDHPGRLAFQRLPLAERREKPEALPGLAIRKDEARAERLLKEALQERWHGAVPNGVEQYEVVAPRQRRLRMSNGRWRLAVLEVYRATQERELELRHIYDVDCMVCLSSAFRIGIC